MRSDVRAEARREKRDLVSGDIRDESGLIRFVPGPDGVVTPDLARKLPGRGLWVAADRASVEAATRRNLFARAAKAKLSAPAGLADQVESLLRARVLSGLGLARRAGELVTGFEKVCDAVRTGRAAWLIEAADGAEDGRRKVLALARRQPSPPPAIGVYTAEELSLALGLENVIHSAILAGRAAERWTSDVQRLSGFRPLLPESWRKDIPATEGTQPIPDAGSNENDDGVGRRPAAM